jgi:hypothetical protein
MRFGLEELNMKVVKMSKKVLLGWKGLRLRSMQVGIDSVHGGGITLWSFFGGAGTRGGEFYCRRALPSGCSLKVSVSKFVEGQIYHEKNHAGNSVYVTSRALLHLESRQALPY